MLRDDCGSIFDWSNHSNTHKNAMKGDTLAIIGLLFNFGLLSTTNERKYLKIEYIGLLPKKEEEEEEKEKTNRFVIHIVRNKWIMGFSALIYGFLLIVRMVKFESRSMRRMMRMIMMIQN